MNFIDSWGFEPQDGPDLLAIPPLGFLWPQRMLGWGVCLAGVFWDDSCVFGRGKTGGGLESKNSLQMDGSWIFSQVVPETKTCVIILVVATIASWVNLGSKLRSFNCIL